MSDTPNSTPAAEETPPQLTELEALRLELEEARASLEAAKDKYLRTYADLENFRRRTVQDLEDARRSGELRVMRALLDTFDDLERALGFAKADPASILGGVQTVTENFRRALKGLGVEPTPGVGAPFDPQFHEAIGMVEGPEGQVVMVYQEGFSHGPVLVRPARVVVGRGSKEAESGGEPT